MNFALLISTFVTVFLAELGDKTQLATVAISGTSDRPLAVFIGSSSALVLASLIGALDWRVPWRGTRCRLLNALSPQARFPLMEARHLFPCRGILACRKLRLAGVSRWRTAS